MIKFEIRNLQWVLLFTVIMIIPVHAVERDAQLAGDQESIKQENFKTIEKEPERAKAGENQVRPELKLPEIIVTGERQYRVSAEKKEMLAIDPMQGTKEIPVDISKVVLPGLDDKKNSPLANTITAKDYLLKIEAGAGNAGLGIGSLVAGYEADKINVVLRADYRTKERVKAFGIIPYNQYGDSALNVGMNINNFWQCNLEVNAEAGLSNQPDAVQSLGDWLSYQDIEIGFSNQLLLTNQVKINMVTKYGDYRMRKGGWLDQGESQPPQHKNYRSSKYFQGVIDADILMPFINKDDLNVLVHGNIDGQYITEDIMFYNTLEELFSSISVRTRFRPISYLTFDIGVQMDKLNQSDYTITKQVILGNVDVVFPWGTTLYGRLDGGLNWKKINEINPEHYRIFPQEVTNGSLIKPEIVSEQVEVGWRQKIIQPIMMDLSWQKGKINNLLVWTDDNHPGLFAYTQLDKVTKENIIISFNIFPIDNVTVELLCEADLSIWLDNTDIPYTPVWKGKVTINWEWQPWILSLNYRYIGERWSRLEIQNNKLKSAHLLGFTGNYKINEMLDGFIELNNLLSYTWEEWAGYRELGLTILGGIRFTF